jgi:hypothetical protein
VTGAAVCDSPAALFDRLMATHADLGNPYTLWVAVHDRPGG